MMRAVGNAVPSRLRQEHRVAGSASHVTWKQCQSPISLCFNTSIAVTLGIAPSTLTHSVAAPTSTQWQPPQHNQAANHQPCYRSGLSSSIHFALLPRTTSLPDSCTACQSTTPSDTIHPSAHASSLPVTIQRASPPVVRILTSSNRV
jgi:hypothetical protein